jgi:hypothetical protein
MDGERLAGWPELARHLVADWGGRAAGETEIALSAEGFPLVVRAVDALGARWIDVEGVLGSPKDISIQHILERNFTPAIGAMALRGTDLVVRQRLPLDGLRPADLAAVLRAIAQQCAQGVIQLRIGIRKIIKP